MLPGNEEAGRRGHRDLEHDPVREVHAVSRGPDQRFARRHGDYALELHAPQPGWRVVDIGCGFGDTTIDLARRVGPTGAAVGIDAAPPAACTIYPTKRWRLRMLALSAARGFSAEERACRPSS